MTSGSDTTSSSDAARPVTFDVFSALVDSRTGGSRFFAPVIQARGWAVPAAAVYDRWDANNKQLHRNTPAWASFRELAQAALSRAYADLGVAGEPHTDCAGLLDSMSQWPLWPDVTPDSLAMVGPRRGLLSNIDDDLLAAGPVVGLGCFDPDLVLTSQALRSYKPASAFYRRARQRIGPLLHIASSARDVRGALEAKLPCIRLARPHHLVDPAGPRPASTASSIGEIAELVHRTKRTDEPSALPEGTSHARG